MRQNNVAEFFFLFASKWPNWLSQTLDPFSHILKSVPIAGMDFSSPKESCKPIYISLQMPTLSVVELIQLCYQSHQVASAWKETKKMKNITFCHLTPTSIVRFPPNLVGW